MIIKRSIFLKYMYNAYNIGVKFKKTGRVKKKYAKNPKKMQRFSL